MRAGGGESSGASLHSDIDRRAGSSVVDVVKLRRKSPSLRKGGEVSGRSKRRRGGERRRTSSTRIVSHQALEQQLVSLGQRRTPQPSPWPRDPGRPRLGRPGGREANEAILERRESV